MAHNFEQAAINALHKLKSMPIAELAKEVQANVNAPLSLSMRQLGYLNENRFHFSETQSYTFKKGKLSYSVPGESSYKQFEAANVDQYISLAS